MRVFAPAKINLCLHVGDRRADGFHDLQSAVVFADVGDILTVEAADDLSLVIDGPFSEALKCEADNLVLRAAKALAKDGEVSPRARVVLTKNLPVASGIGGGSADAAAALRGLALLWQMQPPSLQLAAGIGSDVPVCLVSRPAWMEGRGERVSLLDGVSPSALVLVNPGIAVPTVKVFGLLSQRSGVASEKPSALKSLHALTDYLFSTGNDLEAPAIALAPQIEEALCALRTHAALFARMSGSGATCFGLFADDCSAALAAKAIAKEKPEWWVVATRIAGADVGAPVPFVQ